jgi:hypothetical protein
MNSIPASSARLSSGNALAAPVSLFSMWTVIGVPVARTGSAGSFPRVLSSDAHSTTAGLVHSGVLANVEPGFSASSRFSLHPAASSTTTPVRARARP